MPVETGGPPEPQTPDQILSEFLAKIKRDAEAGYVFWYRPENPNMGHTEYIGPTRLIRMVEDAIGVTTEDSKPVHVNEEARRFKDRSTLIAGITTGAFTAICPRKRLIDLHIEIGTEMNKKTTRTGLGRSFDEAQVNSLRSEVYSLLDLLPAAGSSSPALGRGGPGGGGGG